MDINKTTTKGHWINIAIAILVSCALGALLFPERFLLFNATFMDYTDSPLSYAGSFYVTNSMYHGGIQLWNRYDQMPMTFFNLNFSMYKISNILTALSYAIVSPFSKEPAHLFHSLFSWIFIVSTLCIRVVGVYLLLSLFVKRRWILIAGTVYGSLVLCPQFMMALSTNIIYSLFPLMMYCLLRFFDELRSKHLFSFAIIWIYCIATDFFCGLGYLYQAAHFIIVPGLVWAWFKHRTALLNFRWRKEYNIKIVLLVLLSLVMIGPSVYLVKSNYHDYEFGIESSRMKDPFSVTKYFKRPAAWAPQEGFLKRTFDYTENLWSLDWLYLGGVTVFFVFMGIVAIKDSRKWILCAAAVFFFLLNSPRDAGGVNAIAHWINALSNPLKFLARSFHMSFALLLPFVLLPLAVGGFAWFWERLIKQENEEKNDGFRVRLSIGLFCGVVAIALSTLPASSQKVLLSLGSALCLICVVRVWAFRLRRLALVASIVMLALVFALDSWAMSRYVRDLLSTVLTRPRPVLVRPDLGLVNMDYQNPRTLPLREYGSVQRHGGTDTYFFDCSANMPGIMLRYTNYLRYYQPISNYLPRHVAFASWVKDGGIMLYYEGTFPREITFFPTAIKEDGDIFRQILVKGLQRDVVTVDGYEGKILKDLPELNPTSPAVAVLGAKVIEASQVQFEVRHGLLIGSFKLPVDMPSYYASTFLTPDERLFSFSMDGMGEFKIAQGNLVAAQTFDVNNARDGYLTFALPNDFDPRSAVFKFIYPKADPNGLQDVFLNNMDDLGFVYVAKQDGWLVIHQPFDEKWEVTLDGKKARFYRANKSFIGVPLTEGKHKVVLRYWPHTPIRFFLGLSILVSTLCLGWLLIGSVRSMRGSQG